MSADFYLTMGGRPIRLGTPGVPVPVPNARLATHYPSTTDCYAALLRAGLSAGELLNHIKIINAQTGEEVR